MKSFKLLEIMSNKGYSRSELCQKCDTSYNSMTKYIRNKCDMPLVTMKKVRDVLNLTDSDVIEIFFN